MEHDRLDLPLAGTFGSGFPAGPVSEHLAAQPGVQRVPGAKLSLFIARDFLDPGLCAALIARIDADRRPSAVADGAASIRTSETCAFALDDPVALALDRRITDFTRLHPAFGEPPQGARYAAGQEFGQHTDYFDPYGDAFARYGVNGGQRTWTVMVYLNAVEAGGATRFKAIDKTIQPEAGKLLAWNNLRADGMPNPATVHAALKVRVGVKYVVTKWFRERPWRDPRG